MSSIVKNSKKEKVTSIPAVTSSKKGKGGILHMKFADAFRFNQTKSGLPAPRCDLRVYASETNDNKIIFSVDERNVAVERNIAYVINEMAAYRREHLEWDTRFCDWTIGDFRDCAKLWYSETEPQPKPKSFAFQSDNEIAFHRIDFHIDPKTRHYLDIKPTPLFDELRSRWNNAEAGMAFIASMLIEESFLQQYLYIYGEGGDGKGALLRALKKLFGAAAYTKQRGPRSDDKHYGVSFNKKRLVAFTDSRDPAVVRADYVMALTGDDGLEVEPKGGHGYNIAPYCKLVFLSNVHPLLENQTSEIRRLIYTWMDPRAVGPDGLIIDDPIGYEAALWSEMEDVLKQCLNVYYGLCPTHGKIPQSEEAHRAVLKMTAGREIDNFQEFFEDRFSLDLPEGDEKWTDKAYVHVPAFNEILRREFPVFKKRKEFQAWLENTYGLDTKGAKKRLSTGHQTRLIYGIFQV